MPKKLEKKRSICFWCKPRCILDVYVQNGRLEKLGPSPIKGCPKWRKAKEIFYHPDRLRFPLKRVGERGESRWKRIPWEQALNEIAERVETIKAKHGAEGLAASAGTSRGYEELRARFMNLFGSPNIACQSLICHGNNAIVATALYGWFPYWMSTEKLEKTNCVMFIGRDAPVSHQTIWEATLKAKKERGTKIICIDPEKSKTAKASHLWLQLRPGTDAALLLSMINVIIEEGLYDKAFVSEWCHGFSQLRDRARRFPAEQVSEITWVPADKIRQAARLFAVHKPSCAFEGMGVSQQPDAINALLARYVISAITGNVDVPGGEELLGPAPFITEHEIELPDMLPVEQRGKMLGADQYRLSSWMGYELIQKNVERVWGKRCDQYANLCQAPAPLIYRAIATGKPYPIKGLLTVSSNPMITQANTNLIYRALKSLDLYVVVDMFMTPSAELADYVLPAASWLERDFLFNYHNTTPVMTASRAALPPVYKDEYDRRPDFDFWAGLGRRLGQEEYWQWETVEEYYDYRLKPLGISFKELAEKGKWMPEKQEFRKFENAGFGTPTGKIELYSTVLENLGYDPLPDFIEPYESPISCPDIAQDYPYILITGGRFLPYFHSEFRQIKSFRKIYPHPRVKIHPETAKKNDIGDGDWVWIETQRGKVMQRCLYTDDIEPRVIHAQHGWWFPEEPGEEPSLHGAWISNINVVTDDEPDHCDSAMGSWPLRTMLCNVSPIWPDKNPLM